MMKTILKVALIATTIALFSSCEKMSFEEYLKANDVTEYVPDSEPNPEPIKPTSHGEVVETGLVDLGLSVKWAACNLDETTDNHFTSICSEYGSQFNWSTKEFTYPPENISGTDADNATVLLGGEWRTPTKDEVQELKDKCFISKSTYRGRKGTKITGPSGKTIFLPGDFYWIGTYDLTDGKGYCFNFDSNNTYYYIFSFSVASYKEKIRPVYGPIK